MEFQKIFSDTFNKSVSWIAKKFDETPMQPCQAGQKPLERCPQLEKIITAAQTLLLWEDPVKTLTALAITNVSFWFFIWTRRPISILFLICFVLRLVWIWRTKIWPEIRGSYLQSSMNSIDFPSTVPPTEDQLEREDWLPLHPQALTIPELKSCSNFIMEHAIRCLRSLKNLRERNHAVFCLVMTTFFSITACIGNAVSGVVIVYTILMVSLLTPGVLIHLLPSDWLRLEAKDENAPKSPKPGILDILSTSPVAEVAKDTDKEQEHSLGVLSTAEAVMNIISSHFSTPRDSSPSDSVTDDDDPFEMVQESDIPTN